MTLRSRFPVLGLLGLAFVGCTSPKTPVDAGGAQAVSASPAALLGTSWRLEELGGVSAIPDVEATLEFPEQGKVAGKASCNRFFGTVEVPGESIKMGPLASTKMACIDATDAQEVKYLAALAAAERFESDGPALLIYSRGMEKPLRFSRK